MDIMSDRHRPNHSSHEYVVAWLVAAIAFLTAAAVWALQWSGYAPCEICLTERIPYYVGIPLALIAAALRRRPKLASVAFGALILTFAISVVIGFYHAGLEWKFWPGPTACTGEFTGPAKASDLLKQLSEVVVVRCDTIALRIFGLSLAVWNVFVSVLLIALAALGLQRGDMRSSHIPRERERFSKVENTM